MKSFEHNRRQVRGDQCVQCWQDFVVEPTGARAGMAQMSRERSRGIRAGQNNAVVYPATDDWTNAGRMSRHVERVRGVSTFGIELDAIIASENALDHTTELATGGDARRFPEPGPKNARISRLLKAA